MFSGTLTKLKPGDQAFFRGEIGGFRVQHDNFETLALGVHEANIEVDSFMQMKNGIVGVLAAAPVIGKCLFEKPEA